jgi:hypothetical protein
MEPSTYAFCRAVKWLKSSGETVWKFAGRVGSRVFGKREAPKMGRSSSLRCLRRPRIGANSEFPDSLWKETSPKFPSPGPKSTSVS